MSTHGFVGADLASLCNEAAFVCLRRNIHKIRDKIHPDNEMNVSMCSDDTKGLFSENNLECSSLSNSELQLEINESDWLARNLSVSLEDFEKARIKVRPSAMREVL